MGDANLKSGASDTTVLEVGEVLFDFEGTLVDFQWPLKSAIEECLTALEGAGFKRQWYGDSPTYPLIYNETLSLSQKGHGKGDPKLDMAIIDEIYDKYDAHAMTHWNVYPDTLEMLAAMKEAGFQMGIVSNIGGRALRPTINRLGISNFFRIVITRNEVDRLKPNPDGLLKAAAQLGVAPANVILIGDSLDDVGAARSAGMLAGYLAGGQDSKEAMTQNPADIEITRLMQLPERLKRMNRSLAD